MTPAARKARDTRAVYRWEDELRSGGRHSASMRTLRRLAHRVWHEHGKGSCPEIKAGRGIPFTGTLASYCMGRRLIVLARHHRDKVVLLHELTHALGPVTHGRRFQNLYAELLERYL